MLEVAHRGMGQSDRMSGPSTIEKLGLKAFGVFTKLHVATYKASGGRIGHRFLRGAPVCLVEHIGRKSGEHRTTPLIYAEDGEMIVIVASKGGAAKHPAWFHNLMAEPETTVQVKADRWPVRAREATAPERGRLWPELEEIWPDYATYREKTDREIPIVLLEPR